MCCTWRLVLYFVFCFVFAQALYIESRSLILALNINTNVNNKIAEILFDSGLLPEETLMLELNDDKDVLRKLEYKFNRPMNVILRGYDSLAGVPHPSLQACFVFTIAIYLKQLCWLFEFSPTWFSQMTRIWLLFATKCHTVDKTCLP